VEAWLKDLFTNKSTTANVQKLYCEENTVVNGIQISFI
jgi:hypothetical protein